MGLYVVGITGGSGAVYGRRLLQALLFLKQDVKLVVSKAGQRVLEIEEDLPFLPNDPERTPDWDAFLRSRENGIPGQNLEVFDNGNLAAPIASGSYRTDGMVVIPCSMGALARITTGVSSSLIERAADVTLKERRKLLLVPRETPLSLIHLRNMVSITEAGAEVLPAAPSFYHRPSSVNDLVDSIVSRILDRLDIDHGLSQRWTGSVMSERITRE